MVGHIQPGMGLAYTGSKQIAFGLGSTRKIIPPPPLALSSGANAGGADSWQQMYKDDNDLLEIIMAIVPIL